MRAHGVTLKPDARPDLTAVFEFEDQQTGASVGVTLATLLQCLCIAQERCLVPPFEPEWEAATIDPVIREMARLSDPVTF
jgi:hypothetical protein